MNHILLNEELVPFQLTISKRARRMRITIHPGGKLIVTTPKIMSEHTMRAFMIRKATWILSKIRYMQSLPKRESFKSTEEEYTKYKEQTQALVVEKIAKFNTHYRFTYNQVRIKNQKTLWGSCSRKGNLSFNYKLVLVKERCADYIIVHELCHLKEFNHSARFWNLVAQTIPDHAEIRKELRRSAMQCN